MTFRNWLSSSFTITVLAASLMTSGCTIEGERPNMNATTPAAVSGRNAMQAISRKKIFFGHQSVGANIIEGVNDIAAQHPGVTLRVAESADPALFDKPVLAHVPIGRNSDPESKLSDFAARLRAGVGRRADVATFKFCYVDFTNDTDPVRVFSIYKQTMAELSAQFPQTRIAHVTVPLKATSSGWKKSINNLLGRPHPFAADNLRRQDFNALMRKEYSGRQPLFDLAAIESTGPDGQLSFDTIRGREIPSLANEYTYDSGHLNETARKLVAERFVAWLASL